MFDGTNFDDFGGGKRDNFGLSSILLELGIKPLSEGTLVACKVREESKNPPSVWHNHRGKIAFALTMCVFVGLGMTLFEAANSNMSAIGYAMAAVVLMLIATMFDPKQPPYWREGITGDLVTVRVPPTVSDMYYSIRNLLPGAFAIVGTLAHPYDCLDDVTQYLTVQHGNETAVLGIWKTADLKIIQAAQS